jgi:hypothetical protein
MMFRALSAAAVMLAAAPAVAEVFPQWGFELRIGSFQPAVGDQTIPNTSHSEQDYYRLFYGDDRPLMFSVEFDRYLFYPAGQLGLFLQVGLWKESGRSRVCTSAGETVSCTPETIFDSEAGNDTTRLQIFPITVGVVYRLDWFQRHLGVPLVPYGKVGLASFYWRATGGGTLSTFSGGGGGDGWTLGIAAAGGLALNLGVLSPSGTGEHVLFTDAYLFGEIDYVVADGFGDNTKFDMSDTRFHVGFAFDFE